MNKIQKNQVRLYSIFFINAIYDVLFFFLRPCSSFHSHWYCLVLIFVTVYLHCTTDSCSVSPSLICLPSRPSIPTDVKLIFVKPASGRTTLLQVFHWFPFADWINDELASPESFMIWCPPALPPFFLLSFFLSPTLMLKFPTYVTLIWLSACTALPQNPALNPHAKRGSQCASDKIVLSFKVYLRSTAAMKPSLIFPSHTVGNHFSLLSAPVVFPSLLSESIESLSASFLDYLHADLSSSRRFLSRSWAELMTEWS